MLGGDSRLVYSDHLRGRGSLVCVWVCFVGRGDDAGEA